MAGAALYYTFLNIFAFLFLLLASLVYSLSFNLTNFGPDYANAINLYGDASFSDQAIQLTPVEGEKTYKAGRAMYVNLLHLWDKASGDLADFATTFSFNIKSDGSDYGDGLAFFLASFSDPSDTSMTSAGGLGLMNENPLLTAAVDPFVAVVFDTYSSRERRPQTNVSINIGSTLEYNASKDWLNSISWGANNNAFITYSASSQILQVNFTGYLSLGTWTEDSLSFKVDLRDHLPENVCIGFSAATGSLFEKHTINSWQFNSTSPGATTGGTVISPSSPPPTPPLPNPSPPNPPPPNPPHYHKVRIKFSTLEVIGLCIGVPIIVFGIGACIYGQCRKRSRRSKNTITLGKNSAKAGAKVVKATQDPTLECCANKVGEVPVEPTPECCVNVAQEEPCDGVAEGEEACGAIQAVLSVFGIA